MLTWPPCCWQQITNSCDFRLCRNPFCSIEWMFADGQARHRRIATGPFDESASSPNLSTQEQRPPESLSFSNLSSLIATPAQQFWSNAQVTLTNANQKQMSAARKCDALKLVEISSSALCSQPVFWIVGSCASTCFPQINTLLWF
jgi:hypothetical protein